MDYVVWFLGAFGDTMKAAMCIKWGISKNPLCTEVFNKHVKFLYAPNFCNDLN